MLAGIILLLAASPPVAAKLGLDPFHFVNRQGLYLVPAVAIMLGTSFLSPRQVRRLALVVFIVASRDAGRDAAFRRRGEGRAALDHAARPQHPALGIRQAGLRHPVAWLFAESSRKPDMPANGAALGLLLLVVALLVLQPDFGQTMLIAMVWGALFFMAGMRLIWVAGLFGAAALGLTGAYFTVPHVARRFKRFFDPSSGDTFQIDNAVESFLRGGWFGAGTGRGHREAHSARQPCRLRVRGRGRGIRHRALSRAGRAVRLHRDPRAVARALRNDDPFARFAASGLAILFGAQSAINMAVNLHLIPAKGMTLPFISYGGSSLLSLAYGMGMLLALTRERPRAELFGSRSHHAVPGARRDERTAPLVLLAAGGTGGHLFPAEALRAALPKRGVAVALATDSRAAKFGGRFPAERVHVIPSATWRGRDPFSIARTGSDAGLRPCEGVYPDAGPREALDRRRLRRLSDRAAGAGRHAAQASRRCIHEQNGVMGRANRFLAPRVTAIATGFAGVTASRSDARGQDHADRQSGAAGGGRGGGDAVTRRPRRTAPSACWCSAAARARA